MLATWISRSCGDGMVSGQETMEMYLRYYFLNPANVGSQPIYRDSGIAERLPDLLDEGREDQGCEEFPVQLQDAGCAVHGIISSLSNYHVDASTLGRLLGPNKPS